MAGFLARLQERAEFMLKNAKAIRRKLRSAVWKLTHSETREGDPMDEISDEEFVVLAHLVILGRQPDPAGFDYYLTRLRGQIVDRRMFARMLTESEEFKSTYRPTFADRLHVARKKMISLLPQADCVVDLGGSCPTDIEGALHAMGYPYRPKRLIIVDLPFDTRMVVPVDFSEDGKLVRDFGTIEYVHSSMADLSKIESGVADLVFSGQSIEHVTWDEADSVIRQVHRVLKPGGCFWLDTPNGILCRIQMPDEFIHPEHKHEYRPEALALKLKRGGFEIEETKGICPMPSSVRDGEFYPEEIFEQPLLSDNPEVCYCFYITCRKPA